MANINRREFIKTTAAASLALTATGVGKAQSSTDSKDIRLGIVGMGNRGKALLRTLVTISGVKITALCDIDVERLAFAQEMVTKAGQPKPEGYSKDEYVFQKLMDRDDLDAVIVTTPWEWHTPMAVYGMKAGKYVGVEVPAAQTIEECWELVKTYEQTKVPCMMMENWSFRRDNLAVLNIIRKGLFGQIVHCHCAHSHDCIDHWFFDEETGKDRWPAKYLINRNRDQYPSHQLGPVISWLDIGCGDYYDYMTATATESRSINDYFIHKFGPDHPNSKRKYAQGDIVTTVIKTKMGKTIIDNYDMQLPRPYDNRWALQGTRGIYNEQRDSIYLKDKSPEYHQWEPYGPYQEKYDHIWWKVMQGKVSPTGHEDTSVDKQLQLGHGGTDYLELKLFTNAVRNKTQTPIDIYDSVAMCITGPLSEMSIANGGAPVKCPDFTNGKWKTRKPKFALDA